MIEMEITTYDFAEKNYQEWVFPYHYHYIYILENGKEVYIGETNDIIRRSQEHHKVSDVCYKYKFKRIHVITGCAIEETPAKHYEKLLVKLMHADQKFKVVNAMEGERTHYARKNQFELGFDRLWPKLVQKGLVKNKKFQVVLNKSRYKYSPHVCLTEGQVNALTSIMNAIDSGETYPHTKGYLSRPIFIEGDAGTGKTVVATSLFYYLKTHPAYHGMKIGLVYTSPATRDELRVALGSIQKSYKKDVISPVDVTKQFYDILICDEAHRLRRKKNLGMYNRNFNEGNSRLELDENNDELDWLLINSGRLILFYDQKQIVNAADIPVEDFMGRLLVENRGIRPILLDSQMRICAGDDYVPYIYDVLYQRVSAPKSFQNYELKIFTSFGDMLKNLSEKEEQMGLCRLCGGYAWEWTAKEVPEIPDINIEGIGIWWNKQTKGWLRKQDAKREMGSIYSLPGLDLNYAAVVIGEEVYYDVTEGKIKVNRTKLFDDKVKRGVSDEELEQYILNTYAVFMTRGIYGTYLHVRNDALREYLQRYIPTC